MKTCLGARTLQRQRQFPERAETIGSQISLPYDWEVVIEEHHDLLWLRVQATKGVAPIHLT